MRMMGRKNVRLYSAAIIADFFWLLFVLMCTLVFLCIMVLLSLLFHCFSGLGHYNFFSSL